jgi:hypothetical protein
MNAGQERISLENTTSETPVASEQNFLSLNFQVFAGNAPRVPHVALSLLDQERALR